MVYNLYRHKKLESHYRVSTLCVLCKTEKKTTKLSYLTMNSTLVFLFVLTLGSLAVKASEASLITKRGTFVTDKVL